MQHDQEAQTAEQSSVIGKPQDYRTRDLFGRFAKKRGGQPEHLEVAKFLDGLFADPIFAPLNHPATAPGWHAADPDADTAAQKRLAREYAALEITARHLLDFAAHQRALAGQAMGALAQAAVTAGVASPQQVNELLPRRGR